MTSAERMDHVQLTTLDNGLRVISEDMPFFKTASVGVWVNVGARYESAANNGISHMLEHMAFKGTERRTAKQIAEEIEAVGGHLNAYTSREQTAYFARVLESDLPLAVDLLADILNYSTFAEDELEREREVIVQEIGQSLDSPEDVTFDNLQELAFPGQPIGRPILGTLERVRAFKREDLARYMAGHYNASGMVLAGSGRIDHDRLVELAEAGFGQFRDAPAALPESILYRGGHTRITRPLEQVHLALGFASVPFEHPLYYPLLVYSTILGGGMSSRLFQEVRERRGLAYSIYSFGDTYMDSGLFGIYAGTAPEHVAELVPVLASEMAGLTENVTEDEVARARAQLKAGLLMATESSAARCEQFARQILIYGRIIPTDEIVAQVDAVDGVAVKSAARHLLEFSTPSLATVGPDSQPRELDALLRHFSGGSVQA